eukprot:TRINITY_DN7714_c0_g1_i1.p1 TRINITY_DN7714_c0_g1~~TRINITY_DN7714_c0_g1_i1.p1  ORF type:complete len:1071 (-),score=317.30 TRINITY_DN7714_c0_g1_i1:72-3230(-)
MDHLLASLMSDDNAARQQGEQLLKTQLKENPQPVVVAFFTAVLEPSQPIQNRQLAITLLRNMLTVDSESVWARLPADTQIAVKEALIKVLSTEKEPCVLRVVCDTIADLAGAVIPKGEWPALLPFLFQSARSQEPLLRGSALVIFSDLVLLLGPKNFAPYATYVGNILQAGLADSELKVRTSALLATSSFFMAMKDTTTGAQFQALLPAMLEAISMALNMKQEIEVRKALNVFIELADAAPSFFKPMLRQVLAAMLAIGAAQGLSDDTKRLAIEVVVSFAEKRRKSFKKQADLIQSLIPLMLSWLVDIQDTKEWYDFKEDTSFSNAEIAEHNLNRLAISLGGVSIVPVLFAHIPSLVNNKDDWRQRYAGVLSILICGEGCQLVLQNHIEEILRMILPLISDSHPRVRFVVINCLGQLCVDFGPQFQETLGKQFLPPVLACCNDSCVRVQAQCASTIKDFCEGAKKETVLSVASDIAEHIRKLLQAPNVKVQEYAINALSAFAGVLETDFRPYYEVFVPFLKVVMNQAVSKEYRKLRGLAVECLTVVGSSVGKEIFHKDVLEVMQNIVQTKLDADDPQISHFETAFARIAESLKEQFLPYLPVVLPSALERADLPVEATLTNDFTPAEGWSLYRVGEGTLSVHTSQIEEKLSAMRLLLVYASQLQEGFLSYVERTTKIMVPCMTFLYNDEVKAEACSSPPVLIRCITEYMKKTGSADTKLLFETWQQQLKGLATAIAHEDELENLVIQLGAIAESMEEMDRPSLTPEQATLVGKLMIAVLSDLQSRQKVEAEEKHTCECHDEDDAAHEKQDEERANNVLSLVVDCCGALAKYHPEFYVHFFVNKLQGFVMSLMSPAAKVMEKKHGICFFDDFMEFTSTSSPAAIGLIPQFVPLLLANAVGASPQLRQAAVYGLGVTGLKAGAAFLPYATEALNVLHCVVQQPGSREGENVHPTENAISAIIKICLSQPTLPNRGEHLSTWVGYLPVTEDEEEFRYCYEGLCALCDVSDVAVVGAGNANVSRLRELLTHALALPALAEQKALAARIAQTLAKLQ